MSDYKEVFERIESSLIRARSEQLPEETVRTKLDVFKTYQGRALGNQDYYAIMVAVIFYSGFKAAEVMERLGTINKYFDDYELVANYDENKVEQILADEKMIRNSRKVLACIGAARTFNELIARYGSFQKYLDSFSATNSFENLMLLKEHLQLSFDGLGDITVYHFMTDVGLPVLKPDRVICRIFERLGLIENRKQSLKVIAEGLKFARATGHPIRYVDIVFVTYGQLQPFAYGLETGICLESNPRCELCDASAFCKYYSAKNELGEQ